MKPHVGQVRRLKSGKAQVRDVVRARCGAWVVNPCGRGYRYEWVTPTTFLENNKWLPQELMEIDEPRLEAQRL